LEQPPFLKIGWTKENFHISGNVSEDKDREKRKCNGKVKANLHCFKIFSGIPSGPGEQL